MSCGSLNLCKGQNEFDALWVSLRSARQPNNCFQIQKAGGTPTPEQSWRFALDRLDRPKGVTQLVLPAVMPQQVALQLVQSAVEASA